MQLLPKEAQPYREGILKGPIDFPPALHLRAPSAALSCSRQKPKEAAERSGPSGPAVVISWIDARQRILSAVQVKQGRGRFLLARAGCNPNNMRRPVNSDKVYMQPHNELHVIYFNPTLIHSK